jgi:hypothetical protein
MKRNYFVIICATLFVDSLLLGKFKIKYKKDYADKIKYNDEEMKVDINDSS